MDRACPHGQTDQQSRRSCRQRSTQRLSEPRIQGPRARDRGRL